MRRLPALLMGALSSFWLSVTILFFLFLITYLGTLYQVEHGLFAAQKKYFESWALLQPIIEPISIPMPGGFLLMALLFVNLTCGGIVRLRRSWTRAGIMVIHLGIALMLIAGFVKFAYSEEGGIQLYEGDSAAEYISYHELELVVYEPLAGDQIREHLIPGEAFSGATSDEVVRFSSTDLPFEIAVSRFTLNSQPQPAAPRQPAKNPVADGFWLEELPPEKENEINRSGCYVSVTDRQSGAVQEGILWQLARQPLTVSSGGRSFGLDLRRKRFPLPFRIHLTDFTRELHPGTNMPRKFMSDVSVAEGDVVETMRIQMNEPLRRDGFIVFQSNWGPQNAGPNARLFSGFAVVRNPADQWPLISCIVIAIGMLLQFGRTLFRHVRSEIRRAS